ncbi:MAG TPA: histidine kinase [Xanthomonadaceae bacterium]|nr:histidine kinase [Xanthomonadaceae bacterium]
MTRPLTPAWRELVSPLALASYAALAAVWLGSLPALIQQGRWAGTGAGVALAGFTAAWVIGLLCEVKARSRLNDVLLAIMTVSAFAVLSLGSAAPSPILLILLACALAERFDGRVLVAGLVAMNLALLAIFMLIWGSSLRFALLGALTYGAFQAFAVLVLRAAQRAEAMADELREVNASLLATRSLLDESARDAERLRLSRELHDVAGHKLTALKLNLRALSRDPAIGDRRELEVASTLAGELLDDLRAVVRQLRQHDGLDMGESLRRLAEPLPRPKVAIDVGVDARVRDADQAETLLRVAQEGLTNAARHGGATHAWLSLSRCNGALELSVEDDGRVRWPLTPGTGLTGMRERVERLGGALDYAPSSHGGLRLSARLPLEAPV